VVFFAWSHAALMTSLFRLETQVQAWLDGLFNACVRGLSITCAQLLELASRGGGKRAIVHDCFTWLFTRLGREE
jgi:hypothetical protein